MKKDSKVLPHKSANKLRISQIGVSFSERLTDLEKYLNIQLITFQQLELVKYIISESTTDKKM